MSLIVLYASHKSSRTRESHPPENSAFFSMVSQHTGSGHALAEGVGLGWCQNPNETDAQGVPLLLHALGNPTLDVLSYRDYHAYPSSNTLVEEARPLDQGNATLARRLFEAGANPWMAMSGTLNGEPATMDAFDLALHHGLTALASAFLAHPDAPTVDVLMARKAGTQQIPVPYLHLAVGNKRLDMVKLMLNTGYDLEQPDSMGRTPLFHVISKDMLEALLALGANPVSMGKKNELVTQYWKSALSPAVANEMTRIVQPAMVDNLSKLPEAARWPIVRERASEILDRGQKGALADLMRGAGLPLDQLDFDNPKGRHSLLVEASLALLAKPDLPHHAVMLAFEKTDPTLESIPGVPDAFLAWAALYGTSERKGLKEARDAVSKTLRSLAPALSTTKDIATVQLQVWSARAANHVPHRGINFFYGWFAEKNESHTRNHGPVLTLRTPLPDPQNPDAAPLVLQYLHGLMAANTLSHDWFDILNRTPKDTVMGLTGHPLFWECMALAEGSNNAWTGQEVWSNLVAIEPPTGCGLDPQVLRGMVSHTPLFLRGEIIDKRRAWLERWAVTMAMGQTATGDAAPVRRMRL
jgi:hypothetical protein